MELSAHTSTHTLAGLSQARDLQVGDRVLYGAENHLLLKEVRDVTILTGHGLGEEVRLEFSDRTIRILHPNQRVIRT